MPEKTDPLANIPRPLPPSTFIIVQPEGTLFTDESFSHTIYGTWNVSAMRRALLANKIKAEGGNVEINDSVRAGVAQIDTSPEKIAALTPEELRTPCMTLLIDGYGIIVDGAHRVMRLMQDGATRFPSWIIRGEDAEPYMIHFYETDDKGEPTEVDREKMARLGWGTFPQHSEDYIRRRT